MKIYFEKELVYEIKPWQLEVLKAELPASTLESDIKRRIEWVISHKIEQVYERLKKEWVDKFMNDPAINEIPADPEKLIQLIKAQPSFKDREARDKEEILPLG